MGISKNGGGIEGPAGYTRLRVDSNGNLVNYPNGDDPTTEADGTYTHSILINADCFWHDGGSAYPTNFGSSGFSSSLGKITTGNAVAHKIPVWYAYN